MEKNHFIFNNDNVISKEEGLKIKEYFQNKESQTYYYPLNITNSFLQELQKHINNYLVGLGEGRIFGFELSKFFYVQSIKNNNFNFNEYRDEKLITNRVFNYILFLDKGEINFINLNHTEYVSANSLLIFPEEYTHNFEFINSENIVILNGHLNFT